MHNRLSLRFIYSHNESETNWKLTTGDIYGNILFRRISIDPGNEDLLSCMRTTQNATLQDPWSDVQQNHTCAIAKTIEWIYIV